ncbi:hypothetical protein, partial [Mesorhizobium sp. M7A.F.Ca.CA.001.09.2.1]|uniref:hypothetical protein n=1 Tax=Mesorhizobium sp. M7A.F.Ca.CA.001.09.2.1 TaxID=2496719 RepID=UPI0019D12BA9
FRVFVYACRSPKAEVTFGRHAIKFALQADPIEDALAQLQIGRMETGIALTKARHKKPLSEQRPLLMHVVQK